MAIDSLPFYYKSHLQPDNGGRPHTLPFELRYNESLAMLQQVPSRELDKILEEVYLEGSLVDGSVSSESGLHYAPKIIEYIQSNGNLNKESKILEIGFGSGLFLRKFHELGYSNLYGIEPGEHNFVDGLENVSLISDFYPTKDFEDRVDLIFHSLVLEHIKDPIDFLREQSKQIVEEGRIIFFVPNEEPFLSSGDCSSFIHEHFNFFTPGSISLTARKLGLKLEDLSFIDGLLAVTLSKSEELSRSEEVRQDFDPKMYFDKMTRNMRKFENFFMQLSPKDVAVYVPGRALNILCLLNVNTVRLVDDSSEIWGKYLPYLVNSVEPFEQLLNNPPKAVIIFSRTFGKSIQAKCVSRKELSHSSIYTIDELLND